MQKQRCKEKRWITETDSKHFKGGALRTIKNNSYGISLL